jgi:hypothetical protein
MRRMAWGVPLILVGVVGAASGCNKGDALVVVTVSAPGDAPIVGITSLRGTASVGGQSRSFDVPTGGTAFDLPPPRTFAIDVPSSYAGAFNLHVEARDAAGTLLAAGDGFVGVSPGERADLPINMGPGVPGGGNDLSGGGPPDLAQGNCDGGVIEACGPSCMMCPPPAANGNAACNGGMCGFNCNTGHAPVGNTCVPCGALGQPCCVGNSCNAPLGCSNNVCSNPWTQLATSDNTNTEFRGVWGSAPNDVWAVQTFGGVYHSTGNGTFTKITTIPGSGINTYSLWGFAANDIYIAGYLNGALVVRNTGGVGGTWNPVTPAVTTSQPFNVWGPNAANVYTAGQSSNNAHIEKSTGGGAAFTTQSTPAVSGLYRVWGGSATDLWAAGVGNVLLHYTTTTGWVQVTPPAGTSTMWGIGGTATNNVYIGGSNGWIARWDGTTLKRETLPASLSSYFFVGIWAASATDIYAVGNGGIAHYDGTGWQPQALPTTISSPSFYDVWGSGPNDVYAVGSGGVIVHHP